MINIIMTIATVYGVVTYNPNLILFTFAYFTVSIIFYTYDSYVAKKELKKSEEKLEEMARQLTRDIETYVFNQDKGQIEKVSSEAIMDTVFGKPAVKKAPAKKRVLKVKHQ